MSTMNLNFDIHDYFDSVVDTLGSLNKEFVGKFAEMLLETYIRGRTIFVFGNGGSGATASHICGDFLKGVSYGLDKRFKIVCLNDNIPALMAIANDIGYEDIFIEQIRNFLRKGDLVIAISGSGNSANVVKAIDYAKSVSAKTVAFCGFSGGKIKEIADLSIHVDIDNMEIVEDVHLIVGHCVKDIIIKILKSKIHSNSSKHYILSHQSNYV